MTTDKYIKDTAGGILVVHDEPSKYFGWCMYASCFSPDPEDLLVCRRCGSAEISRSGCRAVSEESLPEVLAALRLRGMI